MNFLKRLELHGFKSFALKTAMEFPARVTAIVGPNGSGKSNIIDALRWVLGERGAKELRGEKIDNLIFAGTPKRPAVGLAKVSLHFNNSEKLMPLDFEEVQLTRRVDRSGVSQFYCNEEEIRLKDLIPMLARARLGTRGLNLIGQGESDIFVKSSGEERRLMIEEILGLKEFRFKKNQAARRLETSQTNMEKVGAMLQELSPHLRILRRQKNKFDKRSEIESALRELENRYYAFVCNDLKNALKNLETPTAKLAAEVTQKEEEMKKIEKILHELDRSSYDAQKSKLLRGKIAALNSKQSALQKELLRLEVKKESSDPQSTGPSISEMKNLARTLIQNIKSALSLETLDEVKRILKTCLEKAEELFGKEKDFERSFAETEHKIKAELGAIEKEIGVVLEEEEKMFTIQQKSNQEFRENLERLEGRKNELRNLERELQSLNFEKEKILLKQSELERGWLSIGRTLRELENLRPQGEKIDLGEADKKMMRLRGELAAIGEIDETLIKEAEESEKRYEFLTKELKDLEKASHDLRNLIKELDERIHEDFKKAFHSINEEFNKFFRLMFGGGKAKLRMVSYAPRNAMPAGDEEVPVPVGAQVGEEPEKQVGEGEQTPELKTGVEIDLNIPKKKIIRREKLSGGAKSLVSLAALFALISVSPPPFLVLDEIDAALDEVNAKRFADLIGEFSKKTQFIVVTHNRATMEAADILYGITMGDDGVSKVLSLKLEQETTAKTGV